jgi:hypothetical protein
VQQYFAGNPACAAAGIASIRSAKTGSAQAGTKPAAVAGKGAGAPGPLENLRSPLGLTLKPVMAANNKHQLFKPVTVQAVFVLTKRHGWLLQS